MLRERTPSGTTGLQGSCFGRCVGGTSLLPEQERPLWTQNIGPAHRDPPVIATPPSNTAIDASQLQTRVPSRSDHTVVPAHRCITERGHRNRSTTSADQRKGYLPGVCLPTGNVLQHRPLVTSFRPDKAGRLSVTTEDRDASTSGKPPGSGGRQVVGLPSPLCGHWVRRGRSDRSSHVTGNSARPLPTLSCIWS
jgi:hypothetical protein